MAATSATGRAGAPKPPVASSTAGPRFAYEPQPACVCGVPLDPEGRAVEKAMGWGPVRFVRCAACGTWIQSPRITVGSLARWYDSPAYQSAGSGGEGAYLDYAAEEEQRRREAHERYDRDLRPLLPTKARVLEVGCATGSLLAALGRHGHDVTGIDLSERFAETARRNGLDVQVCDFLEYRAPPGSFDLILIVGSVSNLQDLPRHLARAADLLRPGGHLYLNAPISDSWLARLYGERFWMFAPSASAFLSTAGCRVALARAGLRVVRCRTDRQRPTVAKLLGHGGLRSLYPLARRLGVATWSPPIALPVPGVKLFVARRDPDVAPTRS